MFTIQNERDAIEFYCKSHSVDDFVYDGLVGQVGFVTSNVFAGKSLSA